MLPNYKKTIWWWTIDYPGFWNDFENRENLFFVIFMLKLKTQELCWTRSIRFTLCVANNGWISSDWSSIKLDEQSLNLKIYKSDFHSTWHFRYWFPFWLVKAADDYDLDIYLTITWTLWRL